MEGLNDRKYTPFKIKKDTIRRTRPLFIVQINVGYCVKEKNGFFASERWWELSEKKERELKKANEREKQFLHKNHSLISLFLKSEGRMKGKGKEGMDLHSIIPRSFRESVQSYFGK